MDLDLLQPDDVCDLLKVKKSWLYDQVEAGKIGHVKLGQQLRLPSEAIAEYVGQNSVGMRDNGSPHREITAETTPMNEAQCTE